MQAPAVETRTAAAAPAACLLTTVGHLLWVALVCALYQRPGDGQQGTLACTHARMPTHQQSGSGLEIMAAGGLPVNPANAA